MKKKRIYIETTVLGYLTSRPSRDIIIAGRQAATRQIWPWLEERFEIFVSALVHQEAARGDAERSQQRLQAIKSFKMLDIGPASEKLAARLLKSRAVPKEYPEDALHIAIAAVNGTDIILTWNFAHLNNPFTREAVRSAVDKAGFQCPEICSPDELLEVL